MKITLLIAALFISSLGLSQNSGLYGKRKYIEINSTGYMPVLGWWYAGLNDVYKASGKSLTQGKDMFNYGFRTTLGIAVKRNVALSLEFGFDYGNIEAPTYVLINGMSTWGYEETRQYNIKHEMLDVSSMAIMPKIEFTKEGGLLPVGVNHQIGIGYISSSVQEKKYVYKELGYSYDSNFTPDEDPSTKIKNIANFDQKFKSVSFLYAFNVRTPISKNFLINYGLRYSLNLRSRNTNYSSNPKYGMDSDEVAQDIGRMRFSNAITFNLGLTFAF